MAETDDLIQSAIDRRAALQAQRQGIAQQRAQIAQKFNTLGGRRNRAGISGLQAQLGNLNAAEREVNAQERDIERTRDLQVHASLRDHAMASKDAQDALHAQVADQGANIHRGMLQLQAKYPDRFSNADQASKFHNEMVQLTNDNPYGLQNSNTAAAVLRAAQFHDTQVEKTRNQLASRLFKETGLSPDQFASGVDSARATNAPLIDPTTKLPPTADAVEKGRANNGATVAVDINGVTHLFQRGLFDNLKQTFGTPPAPQAVTVPADQNAGIQPIVPTYGGQGAAPPGGLVRNPDGSIAPIIPTYGGEGAAPPGSLVRTGVAQIGTPPPTGVPTYEQIVQPNQPLVPPTQTQTTPDTSSVPTLPQQTITPDTQTSQAPTTAATQAATPHPLEGQVVRNKQTGVMGTITNGQFVPQ